MLFAIECLARSGLPISAANAMQVERSAYLRSFGRNVVTAGDLMSDDGTAVIGSLVIIDADDLATAHAFAREEPSARAGLMDRVLVRPWRSILDAGSGRHGAFS